MIISRFRGLHPLRRLLVQQPRHQFATSSWVASSNTAAPPPKKANAAKPRRRTPVTPSAVEKTAEEAVSNILYDTPAPAGPEIQRHLINCLVRNEPGVLSRISSILAARNFNIDSIICAKTDIAELSRMTIVFFENPSTVKQAIRQLEDLVPVWAVLDYTNTKTLERELLMARVSLYGPRSEQDIDEKAAFQTLLNSQATLTALSELTKLFQGRIVDVSPDSVVIELSAKVQRIDAFLALIKPYGILEAARSGAMALPRSDYKMFLPSDPTQDTNQDQPPQVDLTSLPPG